MKVLAGTSGYSYKEWRGTLYPTDARPTEMLGLYAARLPAVEINNTYYRLPKESVVRSWAAQVPDGFVFSIKASRRITHFKRLVGAEDEVEYLLRTLSPLGDRLGAVLFQLPPTLAIDLDRLQRFLDTVPAGTLGAFEFRHPSWEDPHVEEALRARSMIRVHSDADAQLSIGDTASPEAALAETSWGYLRLRNDHYSREELATLATQLGRTGWTRALVFFKHEDGLAGATQAEILMELCERTDTRRPPLAAAHPTRPARPATKAG